MIRVIHAITGLGVGGAETMLLNILANQDKAVFDTEVISLTGDGPLANRIRELDIPVSSLGVTGASTGIGATARMARILRAKKPDIVQSWMYHANMLAGLAVQAAGRPALVWGIRHGSLDLRGYRLDTVICAKLAAPLSYTIPDRIVLPSENSLQAHVKFGYDGSKMVVIPNGFDMSRYTPNSDHRQEMRRQLGIPKDAFVIGQVGRFHPDKDHNSFVEAAALLLRSTPNAFFVLCGLDVSWDNPVLSQWISRNDARDRYRLLGLRDDIPRVLNAFDIASSSSATEGFPNAIGEAMASGLPCVVTDVGDSSMIVRGTGVVVPPGNPMALAEGWQKLAAMGPEERMEIGRKARRSIELRFGIQAIASKYEDLYRALLS